MPAPLGTERAKRAVTELACWVRAVRASASRKIEYYPFGCAGFCPDECMAISLIAASQHHRCPAMRACALALTGSSLVEPVIDAANAFADALQEADQLLSPEAVAALMAAAPRRIGRPQRTPLRGAADAQSTGSERASLPPQARAARRAANLGWSIAALLISLIALAPVIAIFVIALQSSGDTWPHLIANVLPGALRRTLLLMAGVGAPHACHRHRHGVARHHVPLSGAAPVPVAAAFAARDTDLHHRLLLSRAVRLFRHGADRASPACFGWRNAQDYWFPDIRSLGGAIFVMSMVLYPYVYITARASFLAQSVCVLEVSRTLGRSAAATFWEVALPLARPALAAGVALALMETLNDIGAVEFFGVRTLTVAVYDTWLDRNSLAGAAQIACIMLAFVFALLAIERALRAQRRYHHTTGSYRHLPRG